MTAEDHARGSAYEATRLTAISKGLRNMAMRTVAAEVAFIDAIAERSGLSRDDAEKVMEHYLEIKVAVYDRVNGTIRVKHGVFLNREVILRALEACT